MVIEHLGRTVTDSDSRRWRLLPVILTGTFLSAFDFNVVNVAAPSLSHDLGVGPVALELVVGGYAFTYASGLVTGGRLGDLFGYRRLFLLGMAGFTIASLLCGLARSPTELARGWPRESRRRPWCRRCSPWSQPCSRPANGLGPCPGSVSRWDWAARWVRCWAGCCWTRTCSAWAGG